jgi:Repeat of unknown function (DUF5650)
MFDLRRWTRPLLLVAVLGVVCPVVLGGVSPGSVVAAGDGFVGLVPARLLETREGAPTVDGQAQGEGPFGARQTRDVVVVGRGGVPAVGVGAVALNVTAVDPTAIGFLTVFPAGSARPEASNLNVAPGQTLPNMVIVPVGVDGKVSIFNFAGETDVLVDVLGWFPIGDSFTGLVPARLLETREGAPTIDGLEQGEGPLGAGRTREVKVVGRGGVPGTGVGAVALNVTAVDPTAIGFLTVFPAGSPRPEASNLNTAPGRTLPNMVIVPVGVDGKVSIFNFAGDTDLAVDVLGWFPTGDSFTGLVPARLLETREGAPTIDGLEQGEGPLGAGQTRDVKVVGRGGVPATGVGAVALNVTAVDPTAIGFLTVHPAGSTRPEASNLNVAPGRTLPNMVIVPVGVDGKISIFNFDGDTDLVVDVLGWFPTDDTPPPPPAPSVVELDGPVGSGSFGADDVLVLSNGNYVVSDTNFDDGTKVDVGAVYLFDGRSDQLISTLVGATADDRVGSDGVFEVGDSDVMVGSSQWDDPITSVEDVGAVTWFDGVTGLNAIVAAGNSLIGTETNDKVGLDTTVLTNGNYVVISPVVNIGSASNAGAATWVDGSTGLVGTVGVGNSLVGATSGDALGSNGVTALANGNYVVSSQSADRSTPTPQVDVGAATWGDGTNGTSGVISLTNSLFGATANDNIGLEGVVALTNGNYAVASALWDDGAVANVGAVTFGDGTVGTVGTVDAANSLFGVTDNDQVGSGGVEALANGNYTVASGQWDNGAVVDAGAVTWGNGTTGVVGAVSPANSLSGTTTQDFVGQVTPLANGNYVVRTDRWDNGATTDVGAVTWADGTIGRTGEVEPGNSLIGVTPEDFFVGSVTALTNGNYVVESEQWDNGAVADVGAITWADGTTGRVGVVEPANSLIGTTVGDGVGQVTALTNGNYTVASDEWDDTGLSDVGAVTWADGTTGLVGVVSPANSLIGTTEADHVGDETTALTNGNYVVGSEDWDDGGLADVGAATVADGSTGLVGVVAPANSLVGSTPGDHVGDREVEVLPDGRYAVLSKDWDNGALVDAGAVTFGPVSGVVGSITAANSVLFDELFNGGSPLQSVTDRFTAGNALLIGTFLNRVIVFRPAG